MQDIEINIMNSFAKLTDIVPNAYAVNAEHDFEADNILLSNIRRQAYAGDRVLVFCLEDTERIMEIKDHPFSVGEITIIKMTFGPKLHTRIKQYIESIPDIANCDSIYVLGYGHGAKYASVLIHELDKVAGYIGIPIFVGLTFINEECPDFENLFTARCMINFLSEEEKLVPYSLSFSKSRRQVIIMNDTENDWFADIDNPFTEEREIKNNPMLVFEGQKCKEFL